MFESKNDCLNTIDAVNNDQKTLPCQTTKILLKKSRSHPPHLKDVVSYKDDGVPGGFIRDVNYQSLIKSLKSNESIVAHGNKAVTFSDKEKHVIDVNNSAQSVFPHKNSEKESSKKNPKVPEQKEFIGVKNLASNVYSSPSPITTFLEKTLTRNVAYTACNHDDKLTSECAKSSPSTQNPSLFNAKIVLDEELLFDEITVVNEENLYMMLPEASDISCINPCSKEHSLHSNEHRSSKAGKSRELIEAGEQSVPVLHTENISPGFKSTEKNCLQGCAITQRNQDPDEQNRLTEINSINQPSKTLAGNLHNKEAEKLDTSTSCFNIDCSSPTFTRPCGSTPIDETKLSYRHSKLKNPTISLDLHSTSPFHEKQFVYLNCERVDPKEEINTDVIIKGNATRESQKKANDNRLISCSKTSSMNQTNCPLSPTVTDNSFSYSPLDSSQLSNNDISFYDPSTKPKDTIANGSHNTSKQLDQTVPNIFKDYLGPDEDEEAQLLRTCVEFESNSTACTVNMHNWVPRQTNIFKFGNSNCNALAKEVFLLMNGKGSRNIDDAELVTADHVHESSLITGIRSHSQTLPAFSSSVQRVKKALFAYHQLPAEVSSFGNTARKRLLAQNTAKNCVTEAKTNGTYAEQCAMGSCDAIPVCSFIGKVTENSSIEHANPLSSHSLKSTSPLWSQPKCTSATTSCFSDDKQDAHISVVPRMVSRHHFSTLSDVEAITKTGGVFSQVMSNNSYWPSTRFPFTKLSREMSQRANTLNTSDHVGLISPISERSVPSKINFSLGVGEERKDNTNYTIIDTSPINRCSYERGSSLGRTRTYFEARKLPGIETACQPSRLLGSANRSTRSPLCAEGSYCSNRPVETGLHGTQMSKLELTQRPSCQLYSTFTSNECMDESSERLRDDTCSFSPERNYSLYPKEPIADDVLSTFDEARQEIQLSKWSRFLNEDQYVPKRKKLRRKWLDNVVEVESNVLSEAENSHDQFLCGRRNSDACSSSPVDEPKFKIHNSFHFKFPPV